MNEFLNHWFSKIKLPYTKKRALLIKYKNIEKIWNENINELKQNNSYLTIEDVSIIKASKNSDGLIKEVDVLKENHICSLNLMEENYPTKLSYINNSPLVIFYKGDIKLCDESCVGVVGTRVPTPYGRKTSLDVSNYLSNNNVVVVSGMAYGIDTYAHIGALKGRIKKTIAVLGNGLLDEDIYPQSNLKIYKSIYDYGGLILSEYPIYTKAAKEYFPARNRIIAALSDKLIVVEAGLKSGSFITVDYALDYGKEVYAIPGGIYSQKSIGCNQLISQGANMICDFKDIL